MVHRWVEAAGLDHRPAFDAAHQSDVDLQTDEESESCSAIVWLYKRVPSQAVDENGQSWSVCVNVGNLRDTGHSAEPTPPAAMADLQASTSNN